MNLAGDLSVFEWGNRKNMLHWRSAPLHLCQLNQPNPPSTHSELNGAIACITSVGHCWPCCGEAGIVARRHVLRFGRGGAAEGNSHLSAKHLEKERKNVIFCPLAPICLSREKKGKGRHLAKWYSFGSSKTSQVTCHDWQHNETICVLWKRALSQGGASSHGNLLQSFRTGGAVESWNKSQIQPCVCLFPEGDCVGSLMDSWCHLLYCADITSCVSQQHWLHLCFFLPSLSAAFRVQKAMCCCHRDPRCHVFVTVVSHGSVLPLCTKTWVSCLQLLAETRHSSHSSGMAVLQGLGDIPVVTDVRAGFPWKKKRGDWKGLCHP